MPEYIDRAKLIDKILHTLLVIPSKSFLLPPEKDIVDLIEYEPAAEVREVRHAHWARLDERRGSYRFYCSACGGMAYYAHGKNSRTKGEPTCGYPLCPHCGAAMDEEGQDA